MGLLFVVCCLVIVAFLFGVWGLGFGVSVLRLGIRGWGSVFSVWCFVLGVYVLGFVFGVCGLGFGVWGSV